MEGTFSYLIRRLLWVPPILLVVSFSTFAIARFGPGDPIRIASGQFRDEEAFERARAAYGLDKPLVEQYVIYVENVLTKGDFGQSFRYQGRSVREIIMPAIWRSLQYNSVALVITLSLGIPLGIFAARRQGTWADPASISSFLLIQSIPAIVAVPFLLLFLAVRLPDLSLPGFFPFGPLESFLRSLALPASGWPRDCNVRLPLVGESYECLGVVSKEAIVPIIALSLPGIAIWGRYTRAFTLGVLREDYVRTARSKGISERQVMAQHVLRNALLPLSTIVAFAMVGLLEGSFFIETLTGVPGVGRLTFEAVLGRDYDMIMAVALIGATTIIMANIIIDIMYTFIDPRIRYGSHN